MGPSSVTEAFGNPQYPGTPGSSRARIGDLSGTFGKLPGNMAGPITYNAAQINLHGPFSVMGRSVVIYSTKGTPIACCNIGAGPIGSTVNKVDYFDRLVNFEGPEPIALPRFVPFAVVDPESLGIAQEDDNASSYPYWNAARIAALVIGLAASILALAAILLGVGGGAAAPTTDPGDGYVAM